MSFSFEAVSRNVPEWEGNMWPNVVMKSDFEIWHCCVIPATRFISDVSEAVGALEMKVKLR
jgi:hypothetical protein